MVYTLFRTFVLLRRQGHGRDGKTDDPHRRRQVRRRLHLLRGPPQQPPGVHRQHLVLRGGLLPHLLRRRPVRDPFESPDDQLLRLRLQILRQPLLQRHPPGGLHPGRALGADHPVLPPQLHRGALPVLRGDGEPGLHHRADDPVPGAAAGGPPVQWLYPRQGHPRHVPGAGAAAGTAGGPAQRQHRAALGAGASDTGPQQDPEGYLPAHGPDHQHPAGEQGGAGEVPPRPPLRPPPGRAPR